MTHPDPLDLLRRTLGAPASTDPTPECLDNETIAALADGTLDAGAGAAALAHLAGCPRCRGAVASVARALADSAVAREVARLDNPARRRWVGAGVAVAAAAVLLLLSWPPRSEDGEPSHRAPPVTSEPAPLPLAPLGTVAEAGALRWASVAGADRYRVTLFDARGRVLYEVQLGDTSAALPASVVLAPGSPYLWKVEARIGFDRWSASELVEFSIARGPPR